jgi:hypothetical protein
MFGDLADELARVSSLYSARRLRHATARRLFVFETGGNAKGIVPETIGVSYPSRLLPPWLLLMDLDHAPGQRPPGPAIIAAHVPSTLADTAPVQSIHLNHTAREDPNGAQST